jgi:hypothetical protein
MCNCRITYGRQKCQDSLTYSYYLYCQHILCIDIAAASAIPLLILCRVTAYTTDLIRALRNDLTPQIGLTKGSLVHVSDRSVNAKWHMQMH